MESYVVQALNDIMPQEELCRLRRVLTGTYASMARNRVVFKVKLGVFFAKVCRRLNDARLDTADLKYIAGITASVLSEDLLFLSSGQLSRAKRSWIISEYFNSIDNRWTSRTEESRTVVSSLQGDCVKMRHTILQFSTEELLECRNWKTVVDMCRNGPNTPVTSAFNRVSLLELDMNAMSPVARRPSEESKSNISNFVKFAFTRDCKMCMGELNEDENVVGLPCSHMICEKCVIMFRKRGDPIICPRCNQAHS